MNNIINSTKGFFKRIKDLKNKHDESQKIIIPQGVIVEKEKSENIETVNISALSVVKAVFSILWICLLVWFLFSVRHLIILFFISLFFASTFYPFVDYLEKKRVPRSISAIGIFLLLLGIIVVIVWSLVPVIAGQVISLFTDLSQIAVKFFTELQTWEMIAYVPDKYQEWLASTLDSIKFQDVIQLWLDWLSTYFEKITSGFWSTVGVGVDVVAAISSWLFDLVLVLFLTFFLVIGKDDIMNFFHALFPMKYGDYITKKTSAIQNQIGAWVRWQVMLSLIMFVTTFIWLMIIWMGDYALTLALIMAIGEFIPYVWPMIFLVFALPIALGTSWIIAIKLLIFYAILQFIEGNVFVPAVMKKAVGLSPIVVLLALLIGFQFLGPIGAVMAVPVATIIMIFIHDYMKSMAKKK